MGSPLGVLLANFFMGSIEEEVFSRIQKPIIYCRYIDDIFIMCNNMAEAEHLRITLQDVSGLRFTIESSENGQLPFLDVLVTLGEDKFITKVYTKPTNNGQCLNGKSECPQRYKDSTIAAYIRRAITHCSSWSDVDAEIKRSTEMLLNNGFHQNDIDKQVNKTLNDWYERKEHKKEEYIKLYYKAHFSSEYKEDERIMRQIIKRNVTPTDPQKRISFTIYYKNKKTSNLLMRNSPKREIDKMQQSHVIYRYSCNQGDCETLPSIYIGMTTMRLSRRLSYHLSAGAPMMHSKRKHGTKLTRKRLEDNTQILTTCKNDRRLPILEALFIKNSNPCLNSQATDLQALPSMRRTFPLNSPGESD